MVSGKVCTGNLITPMSVVMAGTQMRVGFLSITGDGGI